MTDTSPEAVERLAHLYAVGGLDPEVSAVLRTLAAERDALRLLLARNLVLDLGSGEEGADALGGIFAAIALVEAYREANPLPEMGDDDEPF